MRIILMISVLAFACSLAMPLHAATPINQTRPLDPRGRVEIDNLKGRVEVRGWDRAEVKITGSLGAGVEKFELQGDGKALRIKVKYPSRSSRTEPTILIVHVPLRAQIEIGTVTADIDVHGMASRNMALASVSGDIVANGAPGRAQVESVSGDIRLTFNSGDVEVSTVSGDVILNGRLNGKVTLETVAGDVRMDGKGERLSSVRAGTVSGDIQARMALAPSGVVKMESVSGDLLLEMPRTLSAQVSGESFSGELQAPGANIERQEFGPGSSFHSHYGAGKGEIRLESFSGDAELRLQ
ncbi:MAG: DUF4097 domain-containing protein [Pseudomonadota bacterium]|nr:DUF4097 domain-containing protein [Pseudomonadota bacterium]MDQ3160099.1 DUF4097 domain-containing protein [Pseudomonadota bacterium]